MGADSFMSQQVSLLKDHSSLLSLKATAYQIFVKKEKRIAKSHGTDIQQIAV